MNVLSDLFLFLHSGRFQAPRLRGEPCRKNLVQLVLLSVINTFSCLTFRFMIKISVKLRIYWQIGKKQPLFLYCLTILDASVTALHPEHINKSQHPKNNILIYTCLKTSQVLEMT